MMITIRQCYDHNGDDDSYDNVVMMVLMRKIMIIMVMMRMRMRIAKSMVTNEMSYNLNDQVL